MKKLWFACLCALISVLIFIPITSARFQGQRPNGPRREDKSSSPAKTKTSTKESKGAKAVSRSPLTTQGASVEPASVTATIFGESAPLSNIAGLPATVENDVNNEEEEAAENREVHQVSAAAIAQSQKLSKAQAMKLDEALQTSAPTVNIPAPNVTFEGLGRTENIAAGFGNLSPPDTNGDVGPNHYVQQTNLLVRVWNKAGTPLTAPFRLSSLWAVANGGPGGQCAASDAGDPVVLYDPLADRWLLSQFAFASQTAAPYHQCIAISKTPDPTGAYFLYDFITGGTTGGNEFPDYPHLGVWPDGYYMMVHQFTLGGPFNGTGAYSFNRAKMLAGDPTANYIYFNLNLASHPEGIGGSLPSDLDGVNPPPAGRPNTFVYFTTTEFGDPATGLRLFDFHSDFAVPANSTFTERPESTYPVPLAVAPFSIVHPTGNNGRAAVPQPSPAAASTTALDAITDRLMHRLQYRNQGGYETLVLTHTVGAPASTTFGTFRAAPRYYELRRTLPAGNFAIQEQATFAPADNVSRWMSSAAEDNQGNLALGYSVSSGAAGGNVFPGIRYAGRLATDPAGGLFQGEGTIINGSGTQRSTGNRWGDYSMLAVDPSDDCTFWYTQEYYTLAGQTASTVGWQTRVGSFKFSQCTSPATGTLSGTVTYCETGAPILGALITVDGNLYGATLANGTYSLVLSPGSHSVQISAPNQSCTANAATIVNVPNGGGATYDTCLAGAPKPVITSSTVSGGNGDGIINFDECNSLVVGLRNLGCAGATGVSAVLSSTTPGVSVQQPNSPIANIPIGVSTSNVVPFEFSTAPTFICGTPINFTLTVTTNQGVFVLNFTKQTCEAPPVTVTGTIVPGDLQQNLRVNRNGVPSTCANKVFPGTAAGVTGTRSYDQYSFTNNSNGTACLSIALTSATGVNIFGVSYLNSFNPANLGQNYLGDPGSSFTGTANWSVSIPAGQTMVLVVSAVNTPSGTHNYSATVSGFLSATDGGGVCQACVISVPNNITVDDDLGQCGATVTFPDSTSTGSCGVLTTSPASGSFFPVGTTTVTTTSTSGASNSFTVTVNDPESPNVSAATASPKTLWPPEHQMIPITVNYTATDNCSVGCVLSVTSNEAINGLGDGDTAPDWQIVDAHHLLLRSERSGKGSGRIYTITVTCTDPAGNRVVRTTTVTVPKSQGKTGAVVSSTSPLGANKSTVGTPNAPASTPSGASGNSNSAVYIPYLNLPSNRAGTSEPNKAVSKRVSKKKRIRSKSAR